jgi:hypothetical protein
VQGIWLAGGEPKVGKSLLVANLALAFPFRLHAESWSAKLLWSGVSDPGRKLQHYFGVLRASWNSSNMKK